MADFATLGIKVDSKGVVKATKDLDRLEKQGKQTERATGKLTKSFRSAGLAASVAAGAFAGLAAAKVIKDIANFTQAIADLSAITGATGSDLEFYSESAKEIGRTTSLSASQAATAFKLIASAKPDLLSNAKALDAVTRSAVTLAEASGVQLPEAAAALGSAMNQFGLDASEAENVINILAASSKLGAAEVPAVTEALRNVGSAASSLGIDLAETVAGIQALAIAGRQGADAGTGLRQVMLKLEKTGSKDLMPSIVGLSGALKNLKALNLSNTELMKKFGEEGFAAATALLSQSDNVAELNINLRDTNTATEQAAIRMNTLTGDAKELEAAVEGLAIEVGEGLVPALRLATQTLTDFLNGFTTFGKGIGEGFAKLIHGVILDNLEDLDSAISMTENQLKTLKEEMDSFRLFRINPFASAEDQEKDFNELTAKLEDLRKLRARISLRLSPEDDGSDTEGITKKKGKPSAAIIEITDRYKELVKISDKLNLSLRTPAEIYKAEITLLNELKNTRITGTDQALISQENYARGVEAAQTKLDAALNKTTDNFSELKSAVDGWGSSFADAMLDGEASFSSFAENIIEQLQRIALQQASQPLFDAFGGFLKGGLGDLASAALGSFGFGGGQSAGQAANFATSMGGNNFAGGGFTGSGSRSGGVDGQGGFPAILHPNETIIDHTRGQSTGNISVIVNVDSSGTETSGDNEGLDLGKLIGNAVRTVMLEEKRNGGLLT